MARFVMMRRNFALFFLIVLSLTMSFPVYAQPILDHRLQGRYLMQYVGSLAIRDMRAYPFELVPEGLRGPGGDFSGLLGLGRPVVFTDDGHLYMDNYEGGTERRRYQWRRSFDGPGHMTSWIDGAPSRDSDQRYWFVTPAFPSISDAEIFVVVTYGPSGFFDRRRPNEVGGMFVLIESSALELSEYALQTFDRLESEITTDRGR